MIQQSGFPSAAIPAGHSATQPPAPTGYWAGISVALVHGVTLFFRSLDPRYVPEHLPGQPDKLPAFSFGSGDTPQGGQTGEWVQGIELAARLVSAHTILPVEVSTLIGGGVNLSALTRLVHETAPGSVSLPGSVVTIEKDETPDNIRDQPHRNPGQNSDHKKYARQPPTKGHSGQPGKIAATLGALSSIGMAAAAPSPGSPAETLRYVGDAETLFKIGRDVNHPINGTYLQTADIDARNQTQSIGNTAHPFTGQYDGQYHKIVNLQHCFVKNLDSVGRISHLSFANAYINSTETAGVVACEVFGRVSDSYVENSYVFTSGAKAYAGIGGGYIKVGGTVVNTTSVKSTVSTSGEFAHAGIGGGIIDGTVTNTTSVKSTVSTSGEGAFAGIGGGSILDGTVTNTTAVKSTVTTSGEGAFAGIGGGVVWETVTNTTAVNSTVITSENDASAGIGGGLVWGTVTDTTSVNSTVTTSGEYAFAGIGGGVIDGTVTDTTSVNSTVITSDKYAYAGIGGGKISGGGTVDYITAVNSTVSTSGNYTSAGIGGGRITSGGTVSYITAANSKVNTRGQNAYAGIGGGEIDRGGVVVHIISVNSRVTTKGLKAHAAIGAGLNNGIVNHTSAVCSSVTASGSGANAETGQGATGGSGTLVTTLAKNTLVNGHLKTIGNITNVDLCEGADSRVLARDCQFSNAYLDLANGDVCQVNAVTTPAMAGSTTTAMAGTSVSSAGIVLGVLGGAAGLGIFTFLGRQWISAYQEGKRGRALVLRPFTRGRELAGSALQGIRERMNRQAVPVEQPAATPCESTRAETVNI